MTTPVYCSTDMHADPRVLRATFLCLLLALPGCLCGCQGQATPINPTPLPQASVPVAPATLLAPDGSESQAAASNRSPADEAKRPAARFLVQHPWHGKGVWLKADTHIHTKFSDGAIELEEILRRGVAHGCDVLAITDHADRELSAATPAYFERLRAARKTHPQMVIIAGLEWNVPVWAGREHAVVLVDERAEEAVLPEFKLLFDDWKRPERKPELQFEALRWLAEQTRATEPAVVIYNHPNRRRELQQSFVDELARLRAINDLVVGFEGAPGHQLSDPIGAYGGSQVAVDRWDPAASTVDGEWDQLLAKGHMVWGAYAASDFHSRATNTDCYWPGEFSETWLYAPERSIAGALQALRAGSFFAAQAYSARGEA